MVQTLDAPQTSTGITELLDRVEATDDEIILERSGKPVAVIMNPTAYARLLDLERTRDWATINRIRSRNADKDPDEMHADLEAEIDEMRRQAGASDDSGD